MKTTDRIFIIAATVALVAVIYFQPSPPPIVNVDAGTNAEVADELAAALASLPPYDRDDFGRVRGWPDNTGIPEGQFLEDCRDVCTAQPYTRPFPSEPDPELIRPRVLYANHEHLVCVCLRPRGNVVRYVGWENRR